MRLPEVGTLFQSKYRLEAVLGAGGFATVFRAVDLGADRIVAIKVLTPTERGYPDAVRSRFDREVHVIANLRDPHTIKLFDFGMTPEGLLFMVTEYVPGEDLLALLERRGRLEPPEVVHIMRQVLMSLREAHANGLLHRDIKPANIRVYQYIDDPLTVKVLDFGIAKSVETEKNAITRDGELVGTLRYMSPEQLLSAELSPASDIYSLGVVSFEMLLGSGGIHGNRLSDQMDRLVTGHNFSAPDIQRIGPELGRILDRMAAREESQRFRNADEVLAALSHMYRGPDSGSGELSWSGPLPSQIRRSDELLPPSTGPQTGPGLLSAPPGRRPTTGDISRPLARPIPATDPAFELPAARQSRLYLGLAVVLFIAIGVLGAWAVRLAAQSAEPDPPPAVNTRVFSHLKGQAPATSDVKAKQAEVDDGRATAIDAGTAEKAAQLGKSPGCGYPGPFVGFGRLRVTLGLTQRSWEAFLPPDYDENRPYPLLLLAHENAEQPEAFIRYSKFPVLADKYGFVIIAPSGGQPMSWNGPRPWEIFEDAIEDARDTLCIDERRIYALGNAAGGKVVEQLACEVPAVAAIATTSYRGEPADVPRFCRPEKPIPYLHVAPTNDGYNPLKGGRSCSGAQKISLEQKAKIWRKSNHCSDKSSQWLKLEKDVCTEWQCDAPFVVCRTEGGRIWPEQPPRIIDKLTGNNCDGESSAFPYAEVAWRFFSQHSADLPDP